MNKLRYFRSAILGFSAVGHTKRPINPKRGFGAVLTLQHTLVDHWSQTLVKTDNRIIVINIIGMTKCSIYYPSYLLAGQNRASSKFCHAETAFKEIPHTEFLTGGRCCVSNVIGTSLVWQAVRLILADANPEALDGLRREIPRYVRSSIRRFKRLKWSEPGRRGIYAVRNHTLFLLPHYLPSLN